MATLSKPRMMQQWFSIHVVQVGALRKSQVQVVMIKLQDTPKG